MVLFAWIEIRVFGGKDRRKVFALASGVVSRRLELYNHHNSKHFSV